MKILIRLASRFYSQEQGVYCYNNPIELDWPLPFLPSKEDLFNEDIMGEMLPDFDPGLSWDVWYVSYEVIDGTITPVIMLNGE